MLPRGMGDGLDGWDGWPGGKIQLSTIEHAGRFATMGIMQGIPGGHRAWQNLRARRRWVWSEKPVDPVAFA